MRRRRQADPETAAVLAELDRCADVLAELRPGWLGALGWCRRNVEEHGVDSITRLNLAGYAAEVSRLLAARTREMTGDLPAGTPADD
jgi:hypothetical protein